MANWLPMALKGASITWLMNLLEGSIHSFEELCLQFVANFKGSYERHLTLNDLRAVRQRPDEMLRQYLQRFYQTRHKITHVADSDVISAFREGVTNDRMLEKLGIRDDLTSTTELIDMADKCAKAEEVRLFRHNIPFDEPKIATSKGKTKAKDDAVDTKCKARAVLAAEPERKYKRNDGAPEVDNCPVRAFHQMHSPTTENCF